jgi:formylglycine-generating enzyme required for sulfatase activity
MVRFPQVVAATLLTLFCALAPAQADKRLALIVGNSKYVSAPALPNPANDARLVAQTLLGLGFILSGGGAQIDLDKDGLERAVRNFGAQAQNADVALFYYAGHGVQLSGANYLVPIDANVTREADADFQMLNMNTVLKQMDPAEGLARRLNVVILDACRNNPFGGRGFREVSRGLGMMSAPKGTLISFATQPGNVALDGVGGHSPFTKALVESIRRPGVGLFDTFNEIGLSVQQATKGEQQPWVSNSPIAGQFYFAGLPVGAADAAPVWRDIQGTTNLAVLDDFIERFGDVPIYGPRARERREEVAKKFPGQQQAIMTVPSRQERPAPLTPQQERVLKPGDAFRECENCPEMVVVPAGSFLMGSPGFTTTEFVRRGVKYAPTSAGDVNTDEWPQHIVTIGRPFAVGKFHVTRQQFAVFVGETGHAALWGERVAKETCYGSRASSWRDPGFAQEDSHPVVCVSWDDARAYVEWAAEKTGKPYRLLSEAEFEYAARGRTSPDAYPPFWFGSDMKELCQYGNGPDQTARDIFASDERNTDWEYAPCRDGYAYTSPVGHYKPNAFGLYDMAGNAWQYTDDCYHQAYKGAPADGSAWTTLCYGGREYVVRGGSWRHFPRDFRAAARRYENGGFPDVGFRLARTLAP